LVVSMKTDEVFKNHKTTTLRADIKKAGARIVDVSQNLRFSFSDARNLYSILRREKPDIVHTFLPYAGTIGRVVARLARVPRVVSTQGNIRVAYDFRGYWMDRITLPLAHVWTAAAESIELEYGGSVESFSEKLWRGGRRHFTIPAGVDCETIQNAISSVDRTKKRVELGIRENDVMILMTARLVSWKGHDELIDAAALLPERVHVCFAGWGERMEGLRKRARGLGIESRIHFLGARDDVYELLGASDIYAQVFSRTREGRMWMGPNTALMEGAAAGVPIVATHVPLIERLIEDGVSGKLANVNDPQSLAAGISWIIEHPSAAKEMARKAKELVRQRYSLSAMRRAYADLYTALFSGHSATIT
ncbi:MAG: Glycosyl transferase, group 1, partial [Parcubacteria group bacterium GW2011_GWA2_51_10]